MRRIENIISSCNQCRHCNGFVEIGGNTDYIAVCTHNEILPILLFRSANDPKHYKIEIPKNCPLEKYKEHKNSTQKNKENE